jgi:hypothetical protein
VSACSIKLVGPLDGYNDNYQANLKLVSIKKKPIRYDVLMAVMSAVVFWNVTPCGFGNCLQDYIPSQPRRSQSTNINLTLHEAYRRNNKFSQICLAVQQNCRFNKTEISLRSTIFIRNIFVHCKY